MDLKFDILPKNPALSESFDVYLCNGFSLPSFAINFIKEESQSYQARTDDIYVVSYPKTGTTWLQELVFLVHSDLDFGTAKSVDLNTRFPYIEHTGTDFNQVKGMPSPRLLKTHLPFSLLPKDIHEKKCKLIYITRNPRDVSVSYYHFACMLRETQYKGSFEQFFQRFFQDRATYGPFLEHNLEFWNHQNDENVLFLFYEDLKKDLLGSVKKLSNFLNKTFSPQELNSIVEYCTFKNMSKNKSVAMSEDSVVDKKSNFFRKGEVGDWKNYYDEKMINMMDEKVEKVLKDSDLIYTYEL